MELRQEAVAALLPEVSLFAYPVQKRFLKWLLRLSPQPSCLLGTDPGNSQNERSRLTQEQSDFTIAFPYNLPS